MTRPAYDSPRFWAEGPDLVYGELARAAVALLPPFAVAAPRALDAGTGAGAFARALRDRGARVLATDVSLAMLRYGAAQRAPAVAGDITALPLVRGCVHLAVAGFVLSHVDDPAAALAELGRVVRPGGQVLATAFPAGPDLPSHPVKAALDGVLADHGYRPPGWYTEIKSRGEVNVGSAARLGALAAAAGLSGARVDRLDVDLTGLDTSTLIRWRFGMAQVAPWLAALDEPRRSRIRRAAADALRGVPRPPLAMLVLRARTPPSSSG
jgi:SAM-dependent methyltransferase